MLRLFAHGAASLPALESVRDEHVTLATLGVPLAASVSHFPALNVGCHSRKWGASVLLRSSSVVPFRALTGWTFSDVTSSVPAVLLRHVTSPHWTLRSKGAQNVDGTARHAWAPGSHSWPLPGLP